MDYLLVRHKIDRRVYQIFNVFSDLYFYLLKAAGCKLVRDNRRFKNIHKGERCFIIGLGPSLVSTDLNLLNDEVIFAVNKYCWSAWAKKIKPKYYVLMDTAFFSWQKNITSEIFKTFPESQYFINIKAKKAFQNTKGLPRFINYIYAKKIQYSSYVQCDPSKNMTASMNVINTTIQIAMYMGFSSIYLLGCDFNQFCEPNIKLHCWPTRDDDVSLKLSLKDTLERHSVMMEHHYALEREARKRKIEIINLTPNSLIDAYEKGEYKNIVSKQIISKSDFKLNLDNNI